MPTANLGRVQPIYKGVYNSATAYAPLDLVKYAGTVYWCIGAVTAVAPPSASYWVALTAQELLDYGITATAAELSVLAGLSATTANLNSTAQLSGRNLIINGSGRIGGRGYTSGTATVGANRFTLDRWFVVTSGQNLTFTGTAAGRTMTAPAGGVAQVIEGANIVGGTYVINWTGTATCTVGGVARAKGDTFTLAANANVTVRFFSGTFTDVQIELGAVATPFERVDIGLELARCQRYYSVVQVSAQSASPGVTIAPWYARVSMRALPTSVLIHAGDAVGATIVQFSISNTIASSTSGFVQINASVPGGYIANAAYSLDAEITS